MLSSDDEDEYEDEVVENLTEDMNMEDDDPELEPTEAAQKLNRKQKKKSSKEKPNSNVRKSKKRKRKN